MLRSKLPAETQRQYWIVLESRQIVVCFILLALDVAGITESLGDKGLHAGAPNLGGSIATAGGLVFIGATNDSRFRAFESKTGRLLWEQPIDANGHTIPITYLGKDGKQYVAIMAGDGGGYFGGTPSDSVVAFALGEGSAPLPVTTETRPD